MEVINNVVVYKDSLGTILAVGDQITFNYQSVEVTATIKINNGVWLAKTPNNDPLSCALGSLQKLVGDFEIVTPI